MKQKIIVLTGPTASGKTKLSIQLAKKIDAEIICADSRIVYKDLDIVSAKPTQEEQENIVHHLIDIVEPSEDFSAGDFVKRAEEIIKNSKKPIIISGGTWFYIKSLLDEEKLPACEINPEFRKSLENMDSNILWEKLNVLDSKRASLIHQNNKDKIIRSIELCTFLNMPISQYKRETNQKYESFWFMPKIERAELYERINLRVDEMIKQGLYDEWQKNNQKYGKTKIIFNTIGYKEFYENEDLNLAIEKIKQHTRNFAKRQLAYFKSNSKIKLINTVDEILKGINN